MQRITKLSKFARISLLELGYLFMLCVWVSSSAYGQSNSGNSQLKTVVIDAGHGGKDPGCHGGYSHEKDVCLSMALKLGKLIKEKYPKIIKEVRGKGLLLGLCLYKDQTKFIKKLYGRITARTCDKLSLVNEFDKS